eukprot:270346-Pyramimonas_sp.AAC.1
MMNLLASDIPGIHCAHLRQSLTALPSAALTDTIRRTSRRIDAFRSARGHAHRQLYPENPDQHHKILPQQQRRLPRGS